MLYKYHVHVIVYANKDDDYDYDYNELHDHFTRQSHFFNTRKGSNHVSIQSFNNIGPRIWNSPQKKVNVLVPIAKFLIMSKVFFP